MTTPFNLAAARDICERATAGPWRECGCEILIGDHWWRPVSHLHYHNEHNATFIASARTLLPQALDRISELEQACDAHAATANEHCDRASALRQQVASLSAALEEACGIATDYVSHRARALEHIEATCEDARTLVEATSSLKNDRAKLARLTELRQPRSAK
jgi:hypothetical protein